METEHDLATEVEETLAVARLKPRGTMPKSGDTVCVLYFDGTIGNVQTLRGEVRYEGDWHDGYGWLAGEAGCQWSLRPDRWGAPGWWRVLAD